MSYAIKINVSWKTVKYEVTVQSFATVRDLRTEIFKHTGIKPSQQILLLNSRELPNDYTPLANFNLSSDSVLILTTSALKTSKSTVPEAAASTSWKQAEPEPQPGPSKQTAKISKPSKSSKCLAVLDIDGTIYDGKGLYTTSPHRSQRPHLQEFLKDLYEDYEIIFWSATDMATIEEKLNILHISRNPRYKFLCCLDLNSMVPISSTDPSQGCIKSLEVVWKKYPEYNKKNTIICDDMEANLHLNQKNGVLVAPYSFKNYDTDRELQLLGQYLKNIASSPDLSTINHAKWRKLAK